MKHFLIILISISIIGCQKKTYSPSEFGEQFYESLKIKKNYNFEDKYLSKTEFKKLIDNAIIFKQSDNQLNELYDEWDDDKDYYFSSFKILVENDYEKIISKSELDSITFSYIRPKPGKDKFISWPNSISYEVKSNEIITASINIYFSESENNYLLSLNPMSFNKKWKFWKECKKPMIKQLNKN